MSVWLNSHSPSNAKRFLFGEDFPSVASKQAELSRGLAKNVSTVSNLGNPSRNLASTGTEIAPNPRVPLLSTKQPVQKTFGPFVLTRDTQTKTQPILRKMETYNVRPRNLNSCVRMSNPLPLASLSVTGSSYKMFRFNSSLHRLRGKQPPFSGSNKNIPLQSTVFSPKKGRNLSPSNRPESSQQVCGKLSFPNRNYFSQNSLKEGGLHDMYIDLKDAFLCSHTRVLPKVPLFSMEKQIICLPRSIFWLKYSSQDIYKTI